jgi:hypothetical protein
MAVRDQWLVVFFLAAGNVALLWHVVELRQFAQGPTPTIEAVEGEHDGRRATPTSHDNPRRETRSSFPDEEPPSSPSFRRAPVPQIPPDWKGPIRQV